MSEISERAKMRDLVLDLLREGLPAITGLQGAPLVERERIILSPVWPDDPNKWPAVHVDVPALGRTLISATGMEPEFRVTPQIRIFAVVQGTTVRAIADRLDLFEQAIEATLYTDQRFLREISAIREVGIATEAITGGDRPHGRLSITIAVEYDETFEAQIPDRLSEIALRIDLAEPADLLGTYPPEDGFPAAEPAPRESGPDGRIEIGADITFPPT